MCIVTSTSYSHVLNKQSYPAPAYSERLYVENLVPHIIFDAKNSVFAYLSFAKSIGVNPHRFLNPTHPSKHSNNLTSVSAPF